jgi:hypothetical protein
VLTEFTNHDVRKDFVTGKFQLPEQLNPSLQEIDCMRSAVLPSLRFNRTFVDHLCTAHSIIEKIHRGVGVVDLELSFSPRTGRQWKEILGKMTVILYRSSFEKLNVLTANEPRDSTTADASSCLVATTDAATETSGDNIFLKDSSTTTKKIGLINVSCSTTADGDLHGQDW